MAKIMVIDDEKELLFLLKILIEKEGHEVVEAGNGLEAYNMLTDLKNPVKPDLILLDIMMPQMDGYTFQAKLQETEELKNIPIIIITAKGQTKELFEMSPNVYFFLEKPFEPKNLIKAVKGALEYGRKNNH